MGSHHRGFKTWWMAYCAALWALLFTASHVAWAAGWYIGLPAEQARQAFQRTWFWVYDITAAAMCALGVFGALALVRQRDRRLPHRVLIFLAWCGTGLLVLQGGAGVIKIIYLALVAEGEAINLAALWDVWFCLGAVLFSLALWQFRRGNHSR
jgi:hypothetical protein